MDAWFVLAICQPRRSGTPDLRQFSSTAGRPAALWVFNTVSLLFGLMLISVTMKTTFTSPDPLKVLFEAWPLFAAFFIPLAAVNGVYLNARSKEKVASIETQNPMPNAKPVTTTVRTK